MRDLGTQLRNYMDHVVERADVDALPVRLERAEPDPGPDHKAPRPGWVIAIAAAIIVLLLIGGSNALFNAYRSTDPADEVTSTTEVPGEEEATTTTAAPEVVVAPTTVDQVTMDVSSSVVPGLGTLRWNLVEGDETTLPQSITTDPEGGYMSRWDNEVWHSEDGVVWSSDGAAVELEGYRWVHTDGDWAIGSDEDVGHLYQRVDGEWVLVELPEVPFPPTQGIKWQSHASIPIEDGDVRLIDGSAHGSVDWGEIYGLFEVDCGEPEPCEMGPWAEWDPPSETWRILDPDRGSNLAVLTTKLDGNTLTFLDQATGDVVHEVTGADGFSAEGFLATMQASGGGGGVVFGGGWVSDDGGPWTWTEFPWSNWTRVMLVPAGGFAGFEFVYDWMSNPSSPFVSATVWTSSDATTWVDGGEPEFVDPVSEHMWVSLSVDTLRASVITGYDSSTGMETSDTWVSTDGLNWSQVESPFPAWAEEHEADFGFVVTAMPQSTHMFWVSTDGATWHEVVGPPGSHEPMGAGYSGAGAAGDILWVSVGEESGNRRLWIGRFEQ